MRGRFLFRLCAGSGYSSRTFVGHTRQGTISSVTVAHAYSPKRGREATREKLQPSLEIFRTQLTQERLLRSPQTSREARSVRVAYLCGSGVGVQVRKPCFC